MRSRTMAEISGRTVPHLRAGVEEVCDKAPEQGHSPGRSPETACT
jgi:hypothetical protein